MALSFVSYNVNGIRAALKKGFAEWTAENQFDLICLQETKAMRDQVDMQPIEDLGYHHYWHSAEKKGYSGVAIFSKKEPDQVITKTGIDLCDTEGRVIRADFGDWTVLNCYFPSGTSGDIRQDIKMQFLDEFLQWAQELRKERPKLLICGDYNIAHTKIDIHDPIGNKKSSGFLPEERAWMDKWLEAGFVDAYRHLNPEKIEYSWWSYRANARANNKGWRIDYLSVTENLKNTLLESRHLNQAMHSDHCPVWVNLDLTF
ncbi:MAG: exodeoxyribonuclease III [Saprospiraceae bacterium]|nr:exodeoxyribonuclease III [Saprospiraceae bacterium]